MLVVIVGAGPTGLMAANLLGQAGIHILLLERNSGLSDYARAITIDDEGLRICQTLRLSNTLQMSSIEAHYLSHGHLLAQVAPVQQVHGYPLISTFYQPAFEATLLTGLQRFPCVDVRFGQNVESVGQDEQEVKLSVHTSEDQHLQIRCDYVLACDGGKSTLRQQLGIRLRPPRLRDLISPHGRNGTLRSARQSQRWLVVDCTNDNDETAAAIFFCDPTRPAVSVPSPEKRRRWEFMLLPGENAADLLDNAVINKLIMQAKMGQQRDIQSTTTREPAHIARKAIYTFHAMLATSFMQDRIFLLGDAAHLMPPFGGQGMNSGLRDAHNLCWKLVMVLRRQASVRLLETYQQERFPHVAQMIFFSSLLGKLIMPTNRLIASIRDGFLRVINSIAPLRELIREMRVKPQPRYRHGFLVTTPMNKEGRKLVGRTLPQPRVQLPDGENIPLDEVLGNGFALLRLHDDPARAFEPLQQEIWASLGIRFVCIQPGGTTPQNAQGVQKQVNCVIDVEGKMSAFLRGNHDLYLLVRPDRYVMGVFCMEQAERFAEALQRCIG